MRCINKEDFVSDLKSDEISGCLYGDLKQVEVIGWYKRNKLIDGAKVYVVKCHTCCKDSELFGEGYFSATKTDLERSLPCGCSKSAKWNENQYEILCRRKCSEIGVEFLGWAKSFNKNKTFCKLKCPEHGVWETTTISKLLYEIKMCFQCSIPKLKRFTNKPDDLMIKNFIETGSFPSGTTFRRSEIKGKWIIYCAVCDEENESFLSNVSRGRLPCSCSKNPKIAYINVISENSLPVALKFGVTNNLKSRIYLQNKKSVYSVENIGFWKFTESKQCKLAERICIDSFECGIVSKENMQDGYTETTYIYNLESIINIYENCGGIRLD